MQVTLFVQVWDAIVADLPAAQPALETFLGTGLADIHHVMGFANLTRDRASRVLERMVSAELLCRPEFVIKRPDQRGQPSSVYLLTENGAQVLQMLGHSKARACHLKGDLPILHALVMTDIHLIAHKAGVEIATDRALVFKTSEIRPDHLVTLVGGKKVIFEIEQQASSETLRRVLESLNHKQSFFTSKVHPDILPEVRMILQMNRGALWDRTLSIWEKALGLVLKEAGNKLAFRLFAITRREFLGAPDWEHERHLPWREILPQKEKTLLQEDTQEESIPGWVANSPRENQMVLLALRQVLQENANIRDEYLRADPMLLENMRIIYSASHDECASPMEQAALPRRSIAMLKEYLQMVELLTPLRSAIHAMSPKTTWSPTMILHRMQVTMSTFLGHHGWRPSGALLAYPAVSRWDDHSPYQFHIKVTIRNLRVLIPKEEGYGVEPSQDEVKRTEEALEWVLQALFIYSIELGLGRIEFW